VTFYQFNSNFIIAVKGNIYILMILPIPVM